MDDHLRGNRKHLPWAALVGIVVIGAVIVGPSEVDKDRRYLCQASLILADLPFVAGLALAEPEWDERGQRAQDEMADRLDALHPPALGEDWRVGLVRHRVPFLADELRTGRGPEYMQWSEWDDGRMVACEPGPCWSFALWPIPRPSDCLSDADWRIPAEPRFNRM